MSDAALVRASDAIVVARVGRIATAALGDGRIVTRIALDVERALKGGPPHGTLLVTEHGGRVGGRAVVVLGAPEYATGERVLAFLRRRADGSLATTALALGKYAIVAGRGGEARARRARPILDERPLEAFAARVVALARGRPGTAADGRAGLGAAPPVLETVTAAFTFNGTQPARWFEADCGDPVPFALADANAFPAGAGRAALDQAIASWSAVDGASLRLGVAADASPVPSLLGGHLDGRNVVHLDDPFDEVPDVDEDCTGVLARGGFAAAFQAGDARFARRVGGITFGRIVEGDVTLNQGLAACPALDPAAIAEIVAHEIGHAIGLGHSSENPAEPDPVLSDALMYFLVHLDGRGASVRADDAAGVRTAYPAPAAPATDLERLACRFDLGLVAARCFDRRLPSAAFVRFARARGAAVRAARTEKPKRQRRLLGKALRQLGRTDVAMGRGIPGGCGEDLRALVARLSGDVTALLAGL